MRDTTVINGRDCFLKYGRELTEGDKVAIMGMLNGEIAYVFWTITGHKASGGFFYFQCKEGTFMTTADSGHYVSL